MVWGQLAGATFMAHGMAAQSAAENRERRRTNRRDNQIRAGEDQLYGWEQQRNRDDQTYFDGLGTEQDQMYRAVAAGLPEARQRAATLDDSKQRMAAALAASGLSGGDPRLAAARDRQGTALQAAMAAAQVQRQQQSAGMAEKGLYDTLAEGMTGLSRRARERQAETSYLAAVRQRLAQQIMNENIDTGPDKTTQGHAMVGQISQSIGAGLMGGGGGGGSSSGGRTAGSGAGASTYGGGSRPGPAENTGTTGRIDWTSLYERQNGR